MILIKDNQYQSDNALRHDGFQYCSSKQITFYFISRTKISYPPSLQDQYLLAVVPTDGIHSGCN